MLVKMDRGRTGSDVRSIVLAAERINRVLPEITFLRRQLHRFARRFLESNLVETHRAIDVKQDAARVLANGLRLLFRQLDVAVDYFHRGFSDGSLLLLLQRAYDRVLHVV